MFKLLFAAVVLIAVPAWCQTQTCDSCRYGMVTVTTSQTLQVNVAAPPGQSCSAQVEFLDSSGNPLASPTVVNLAPGQSQPVPVQHKLISGVKWEAVPLVAPVTVTALPPPPLCASDVEIVDNLSGFTRVLIPPGPQAQPPGPSTAPAPLRFPPTGLAWGQGIRVNVVAPLHPPQPCIAILSFVDAHGTQVGPAKAVSLAPGQADSLELNSIGLIGGPLNRIALQPNVAIVSTPAAPSVCVPTVEVFDNLTQSDWVVQPPDPSGS